MDNLLKNLRNLHSNIAQDVWPNGEDRVCQVCGYAIHMTTADCGEALAHGWPLHCGKSMLLQKTPVSEEGQNG